MNTSTKNAFRPTMEKLEDRLTPAKTTFVLDFTPDYRQMGSLYETFYNVRFNDGSVPAFFDFDKNGQLTPNDVTLAANEITARVRGYFKNYLSRNLTIIGGDVNPYQNQLLGDQWLRYGLKTKAETVSVLQMGGRSVGGEYGRAPLAKNGYNVEGFGEVYVRTIAIDLWNRNPNATSSDFAISVASTAAHELGHMMGLRHATSGPSNNLMVPGRGKANNYFPDKAVYTDGGAAQNAHHELWYSFGGQPTYYQVVSYGVPDAGDDHHHDELEENEQSELIETNNFVEPADYNLATPPQDKPQKANKSQWALDAIFAGSKPATKAIVTHSTSSTPAAAVKKLAAPLTQQQAITRYFAQAATQSDSANLSPFHTAIKNPLDA